MPGLERISRRLLLVASSAGLLAVEGCFDVTLIKQVLSENIATLFATLASTAFSTYTTTLLGG